MSTAALAVLDDEQGPYKPTLDRQIEWVAIQLKQYNPGQSTTGIISQAVMEKARREISPNYKPPDKPPRSDAERKRFLP